VSDRLRVIVAALLLVASLLVTIFGSAWAMRRDRLARREWWK